MPPEVTAKLGLFVSLQPHSLWPKALCLTARLWSLPPGFGHRGHQTRLPPTRQYLDRGWQNHEGSQTETIFLTHFGLCSPASGDARARSDNGINHHHLLRRLDSRICHFTSTVTRHRPASNPD